MREISNAADAKGDERITILMFGNTGAGKTTLFRTLPGKKFAYLFDPNSLASLQGDKDIDYVEFLPDILPMAARSLSKEQSKKDRELKRRTSDLYHEWENDYEERLEVGWFAENNYHWLMFDSITTFSTMVMDRILTLNGRPGEWPQQDDYGPQMNAILQVFRTATSHGLNLFVTGHMNLIQDELSKRIFQQPMVTGQLRVKLPLLFSQIFFAECSTGGTEKVSTYTIQTRPDRLTPLIRCTLKNLDFKFDVTIDDKKEIQGQGLGSIFKTKEEVK